MAGADFDAIVRAVVRELGGAGAEGPGSFVQAPPVTNGGTGGELAMVPHPQNLPRIGGVLSLTPGRTGGALEFAQVLPRFACRADVILGETQTFIYAAEQRGPGTGAILK